MKITRAISVVILAALGTSVFGGTTAIAATASEERSLSLTEAIASLPLADESRAGYQRSAFRHWVDSDRDGCSTRNEVLIEEALTAPDVDSSCRIGENGSWYSYYDNEERSSAGALDIDHMVPLAEAWDSGASGWTPQRRQDYANDLGDPRALVAVTARSNRSKSDQDPATWMPPYAPATCQYISDWVAVKTRWSLSLDTNERDALTHYAQECADDTITVDIV